MAADRELAAALDRMVEHDYVWLVRAVALFSGTVDGAEEAVQEGLARPCEAWSGCGRQSGVAGVRDELARLCPVEQSNVPPQVTRGNSGPGWRPRRRSSGTPLR
jgi:hypothetical protein